MLEISTWSNEFNFTLIQHTELDRTTPLISDLKSLLTAIGDEQSLLNSIKGNKYYLTFEEEGNVFDQQMSLLDKYGFIVIIDICSNCFQFRENGFI